MSGTLPYWLERWLGVASDPGEGTAWTLDYVWPLPAWATLLAVALAGAYVVGIYLRENRRAPLWVRMTLAGMRLALVALLLVMLAQVTLALKRTGLPYVAVLLDNSQSMTIADSGHEELAAKLRDGLARFDSAGAEPTRWNLARALLLDQDRRFLRALGGEYKLRLYYLADTPSGARAAAGTDLEAIAEELRATEAAGKTTRLGDAIHTILDDLRGTAPAAIVALTDGITTEGAPLEEGAASAERRGVPLFLVGIGDDQPARDVKLTDLLVDDLVFVGDILTFEARLTATGFAGEEVNIVLRKEGEPEPLSRKRVTLGPDGGTQTVRMTHRPESVGQFRYVLEAEPLEGELQTENNRQERSVTVSDEKIRVLLVQDYPNYEFRYLWNMLTRAEESIEVHAVLQQADPELVRQDAEVDDDEPVLRPFPLRREELFSYDVIIFGDVNPALISETMLEGVVEFVDRPGLGGAVVFIAGPQFMPAAYRDTPLARLFPADPGSVRLPRPDEAITEGFQVRPTELGLLSPPLQLALDPAENARIWEGLPPLYWFAELGDLKPGVRVLAGHARETDREGRPRPIVCLQYVGSGKVLMHATDETWRWRWRAGDRYFQRYWVQMIRYLARSKLAAEARHAVLTSDRREYTYGEPVRLRVRFLDERQAPAEDDGVTVVVEHAGHQTQRIALERTTGRRGTFEATLPRPGVGPHHAWVAIPTLPDGAPSLDFSVVAPPGEFERIQTDLSALRQAARVTGGQVYALDTAARLPRDLPPGRQVPIEPLPPRPLWNQWPLLFVFLLLLTSEWILRKLGGMV